MSGTLARTAVRIAALVLRRDSSAEHQCFRVKNLHAEEVVQFVRMWPGAADAAGLSRIRLIVADDLDGAIASGHVAEPGYSITHYRNHNRQGLVYVETSIQSDEQGLQNMFSLRDSNLLDGSFDDYAKANRGVAGLMIEEAWRDCGGVDTVPALLLDRLLSVIRHVHPDIVPVPVRRFVAFAEQACRMWMTHHEAIDGMRANRIVGDALWAMDMFPDAQWNDGGADVRCRRRLEMNVRHADLLDGVTELTADEVAVKANAARFVSLEGLPLPVAEAGRWRQLCTSYGRDRAPGTRRQIPYAIFSQLFARDTAGLRLGDRIRAELESVAPERVAEFDALDATSGLNARSNHAAAQLLEAAPPTGCRPLVDVVSAKTRKSIERLAVPPRRRFFNPAIEIVRLAQRVRSDAQEGRSIARVAIELSDADVAVESSPSLGLFAFMFGSTLESVSSGLDGLPGGCQLVVDRALVRQHDAPSPSDSTEGGMEDEELAWSPLALKVTFSDQSGRVMEVVDQLEWCPPSIEHFAFLWLLAVAPDSPAFDGVGTLQVRLPVDSKDWLTPLIRRQMDLGELTLDPGQRIDDPGPLMRELMQLRQGLKDVFASTGLNIAALRTFLDAWQRLLIDARRQFVPDGVRSRELEAFLGSDLLQVNGSDRRVMLAFHPIRLRWICGYLEQTRRLACDFLSGEAAFADGEGRFYLDWLEGLTPRESPPIAVGHQGQLLYSRSEIAWCEDFSPHETDSSDISCDDDAIASIAARIVNYLDAHPYKRDGLSLLVVLPTSDSMPAEILRRIATGANKAVRVSIVVAAPKTRWEAIARAVEDIADDASGAPRSRLFPDRDLALLDFRSGQSIADLLSGQQIDIAVVTHVLQEQIVSQPNTEAPVERPGSFDPLQHRPLRIETGSGGSSVSLVMLPKYPDPVLESWSTLAVRANRCRPVAPSQPDNVDLIELRVSFQDSARLFHDLHDHCHWVITLERHITRDQIESVEAGAPDVLSIEDGVGANRLSTLVVSSRSGRELIRSRLVRKLQRLVPHRYVVENGPDFLTELADGIHESTRQHSPRLALQALGVARVTEEIVGVTVARHLAERRFPARPSNGLTAWISLDEHTDWFGGSDQVRADMCRIMLERQRDGSIVVDVLVLEGKLRQLYDEHGVLQVRRTCEFFRSILGGHRQDGVSSSVDADMWRELLATAIENVADDAVHVNSDEYRSHDRQDVLTLTLSSFRMGPVLLRNVTGVYSACLWESDDERLLTEHDGDVVILRSTRHHLVDLVREPARAASVHLAQAVPPVDAADRLPADSPSMDDGGEAVHETNENVACPVAVTSPVVAPDQKDSAVAAETSVLQLEDPVPVRSARSRLSEDVLKRIYDEILGCFAMHGVPVSAARQEDEPFLEGPASILVKVRPGPGIDPRKLVEKGAALKLALSLAQEQNVSFGIDRGFVTIDVPKSPEQRYFVDASETWARWTRPEAGLAVPIGEDRFGELVELNFSSANSPHLLVAGTTGSGKSEALNTILFGLVRHYSPAELRLMLVDPKGTELTPFEGSSYLEGQLGWNDEDAHQLLSDAVEEMQRRYQLFKEASRSGPRALRSLAEFNEAVPLEERLPWWLIVLDEYADLTHDPQSRKSIEAELKRLAQKARAAGIHVIIATQKPSAEVISTNLRSNLPAQLVLRVKSGTESRVVIDEAGAENLNGKGDALLKADGRLLRIQCSRVDPANMSVLSA